MGENDSHSDQLAAPVSVRKSSEQIDHFSILSSPIPIDKPVLTVNQLSFGYGQKLAINSISFQLKPGTLTALVGPNGAGKSTLLHLLQGRLPCCDGCVKCNGSVALMPQKAAIDWSFPITVQQMVKLGKTSNKRSKEGRSVEQLLNLVGMAGMESRRLNQLSGGQQQRVLLARALIQESDILLLDEPYSAIDPPTRAHLLDVMRQQAEVGQTLLVSSHDWGKALDSYDRVLVIDRHLVANGTPAQVRNTISDMDSVMGDCCG